PELSAVADRASGVVTAGAGDDLEFRADSALAATTAARDLAHKGVGRTRREGGRAVVGDDTEQHARAVDGDSAGAGGSTVAVGRTAGGYTGRANCRGNAIVAASATGIGADSVDRWTSQNPFELEVVYHIACADCKAHETLWVG